MCSSEMMDNPGYQHDDPGGPVPALQQQLQQLQQQQQQQLQQRPLPGTPGTDAVLGNIGEQLQPLHQPLYHALGQERTPRTGSDAGRRSRSLRAPPRRPPPPLGQAAAEDANQCTLNNSRVSLASWSPSSPAGSPGVMAGQTGVLAASPAHAAPPGSLADKAQQAAAPQVASQLKVRRNFISSPPEYQPGLGHGLGHGLGGLHPAQRAQHPPAWPHKLHPLRNALAPALAYPMPVHGVHGVPSVALLQVCNNQLVGGLGHHGLGHHLGEEGLATKKPCRCPPEEPVHEYSSILSPASHLPHKVSLAASTEPLYWSPILKRAAGGPAGGGVGAGGVGSGAAGGGAASGDEGTLKRGWYGTSRVVKYIVQRRAKGAKGGKAAKAIGKGGLPPRWGWRCLLWLLGALAVTIAMAVGLAAYLTSGFGLLKSTEAALKNNGMVTLAGEFRVLSERWTPSLRDPRSAAWRTLADRIQTQLDALFEASALAPHYRHSRVTSLREDARRASRDAVDVGCDVVLGDAAALPDLVEHAGLAFLRGLRHRAGRAWLGDLAVDVQSIGFAGSAYGSAAASPDESAAASATPRAEPDPSVPGWAPWSAWSECYWTGSRDSGGGGTMVRLRSRACALDGGRGRALDGPEPCLLRLPSAGSHFEMEACTQSQPAPGAPTAATILIQDTVVALSPAKPSPAAASSASSTATPPTTSASTGRPTSAVSSSTPSLALLPSTVITPSAPTLPSTTAASPATGAAASSAPSSAATPSPSAEPSPSPFSMTTLLVPVIVTERPTTTSTTTVTARKEPRHCDECEPGEVCVALGEEQVPRCHPVKDPHDPTGCGGHCKLNFEFCQRLDVDAFRCVDDSVCLPGEWRCGNQLCIPLVKRCDGHFNCYDHTDEHNCECNLQTHFQCGNKTSCLPSSKRCDGVVDCWDAADELNCTRTVSLSACPRQDQFTCSNGQCIPHARFCDGFADCGDKSDEPFGCGGDCKNHEWKCGNGRCIRKRAVCNGVDDCGDHSDERECRKSRIPVS